MKVWIDMKTINILIIGIGHHARRIYVPVLHKMSLNEPLKIFGLDIVSSRKIVESYLQDKNINMPTLFIEPSNKMSLHTKKILNKFVIANNITGVIISTSPSFHKIYANWALDKSLHILMDKPITANEQMANEESKATALLSDYSKLVNKYETLFSTKKTVFMINTQRRFEIGFQFVFSLIREVSNKFNIPVTSIQATHSDGVWIFPDEMVEQQCHPFFDGYGKCSHSGFHLFDIVWQFYKNGLIPKKYADSAEIYSSFLNPGGVLKQFDQSDYKKVFGHRYYDRPRRSTHDLAEIFNGYGEIDAFTVIRLLNNGDNVCNISLNLLHNSFSRRSWITPAKDLYKGNGRVKHQYYFIQQGPFQCIQIHNYQSKSTQDHSNIEDYKIGGNNHFDIYIFRNKDMFRGEELAFRKVSLKDLIDSNTSGTNRLYHETTKEKVIREFIDAVRYGVDREKLTADIATYQVPVKIMKAIYQSNARYRKHKNPLVKFDIQDE